MPHYVVLSPEHQTRARTELEPPEVGRDVALVVNAPDAQAAKWAAARLWDEVDGRRSWPNEARGDNRHPLTGVTVERVSDGDEELDPRGWRPYYADLAAAPALTQRI